MVTLDFYDALFDSSTGTAALLEGFGEYFEFCLSQRHAADGRDALAFSAAGFTADAHDTVQFGQARLFAGVFTATVIDRGPAVGTRLAMLSGVNEATELIT